MPTGYIAMNIHEIRQKNFLYLASKYNGRAAFAEKLGYNDASYINQIASGHINMGPGTAKRIEAAENLAPGWINQPHPELWEQYELTGGGSKRSKEELLISDGPEHQLESLSNEELADLLIKISEILRNRH